eukprot:scaffold328_cov248-Pinguiococcus_pyrenoidosus.AAC.13
MKRGRWTLRSAGSTTTVLLLICSYKRLYLLIHDGKSRLCPLSSQLHALILPIKWTGPFLVCPSFLAKGGEGKTPSTRTTATQKSGDELLQVSAALLHPKRVQDAPNIRCRSASAPGGEDRRLAACISKEGTVLYVVAARAAFRGAADAAGTVPDAVLAPLGRRRAVEQHIAAGVHEEDQVVIGSISMLVRLFDRVVCVPRTWERLRLEGEEDHAGHVDGGTIVLAEGLRTAESDRMARRLRPHCGKRRVVELRRGEQQHFGGGHQHFVRAHEALRDDEEHDGLAGGKDQLRRRAAEVRLHPGGGLQSSGKVRRLAAGGEAAFPAGAGLEVDVGVDEVERSALEDFHSLLKSQRAEVWRPVNDEKSQGAAMARAIFQKRHGDGRLLGGYDLEGAVAREVLAQHSRFQQPARSKVRCGSQGLVGVDGMLKRSFLALGSDAVKVGFPPLLVGAFFSFAPVPSCSALQDCLPLCPCKVALPRTSSRTAVRAPQCTPSRRTGRCWRRGRRPCP